MTTQATKTTATWQGSLKTAIAVRKQIAERWGEEEAEKYNPLENCFTWATWKAKGFSVKQGEKALRSYTYIKEMEVASIDGKAEASVIASHPKSVCLFYYLQVQPITEKKVS